MNEQALPKGFAMEWRHNAIAALAAVVLLVSSWSSMAAETAAEDDALSADDRAAVERITAYFNGFNNLQGEFVQQGPSGSISQGIFYIAKPGKLRFEYAPPNPFLVVADGSYVIVRDRRLDRADHYPLSITPLRLVLSETIDLLSEATIIHVYQDPSVLSLTVEDKDQWVPGQLTLVFDNENFELSQWVIVDGDGNRTTVYVTKLESDIEADPALFVVDLPRGVQDDNR
jgi:outer membrane lipoprotein-sorting protein